MVAVPARLIVSMSGLTSAPDVLGRADAFATELDARGVPLSQLFRPGPLTADTASEPLVGWLHARRSAGDAIVLHGYDHSTHPLVATQLPRMGRRAEFAALPRHEAGLRLRAARRTLGVADLRTDLFVPPRWIASAGTVEALRDQGFHVLADEGGVRVLNADPAADVLVRSRVLGFRVSRDGADDRRTGEAWRCRMLASDVGRTARRGGLVRLNVRAKDLRRPNRVEAALAAVDAALHLGAVPVSYRVSEAAATAA